MVHPLNLLALGQKLWNPSTGAPAIILWMGEIHFAPPKKPWNDDSPVNTNKHWCPMISKWCRISSIHSVPSSQNHIVPIWPCVLIGNHQPQVIDGHEPPPASGSLIQNHFHVILLGHPLPFCNRFTQPFWAAKASFLLMFGFFIGTCFNESVYVFLSDPPRSQERHNQQAVFLL